MPTKDYLRGRCNHGFGWLRAVSLNKAGPYTTKQYQATGSPPAERWRFDGTTTFDVAVGPDGAVIVASAGTVATRQLTSDGILVWTAPITGGFGRTNVNAVAVDSSGNVLVGSTRQTSLTARKYDSGGSLQWSRDTGNAVLGIASDDTLNVYTSHADGGFGVMFTKYDAAGTLQYTKTLSVAGRAKIPYRDGFTYSGGDVSASSTTDNLYKLDPADGSVVWSRDFPNTPTLPSLRQVTAIAVDSGGNVLACGLEGTGGFLEKYDSTGSFVWSKTHGGRFFAVAVDGSDNVYVGGASSGGVTHRKYDSAGTLLWSDDFGNQVNGIAIGPSGRLHVTGLRVVP